ncbi:MAG TPA: hypothetical protein VE981_15240 [Planctomycetota bacterium]|nr:hypothetical protein [Planctomycetota bacterium]
MRLCGILLCLLAQESKPAPQDVIAVQVVGGSLSAWRAGGDKIEPIDKTGKVAPADRLGTLNGDPARFATEGGLVVQLRGIKVSSGKGLALERRGGTLALKLYKGILVVESYESDIELETPFGKIAGKEVCFLASVDEKSTKVVALEGKVTFTNDLGSVSVGEGMSSDAESGRSPAAPRASSSADLDAARALEEPRNLISNPGFENKLTDWKPPEWMHFAEETRVLHSGRACARFTCDGVRDNQPVTPPRTLKGVLKPGTKYLFRFYVRTENFQAAGKSGDLKCVLDRSGTGKGQETQMHHLIPASEGAWTVHRFMFEASSPDLWFALFCGDPKGPYTGAVYLDDFFLGEFPARPK